MNFTLLPIEERDLAQFKAMAQEAFQKGYEDWYGQPDEAVLPAGDTGDPEGIILPEEDIDRSLNAEGAAAYKAVVDGEMVGGAIVVIDEKTQRNSLDFLFVKYGVQSRGIGKAIWFALERLYPETKVWVTCTPYFDKRNIHFYVNVCKFHIVEFFNEKHPDPHDPQDFGDGGSDGMFEFEKQMKSEGAEHDSGPGKSE